MHWILTHWPALLAGAATALTLASAIVGATSIRTRALPILGHAMRVLDRVSYLTHKDAPGTFQWPFLAVSIAQAVADEAAGRPMPGAQPPALDPKAGAILPRVPPLPVLLCLALLAGCTPPQLPPVANCVPRDTRCSEAGIPEVCSGSARWWHLEGSATCASAGLRCCRNRDQSPQPIYSCVPPSACIPEPESDHTDAGVSDAE